MIITRISPFSRKTNSLDLPVTDEQMKKYEDGALLQDAFPHLTRAEREFIKSGLTADDWKAIFG
jgi:hypothetical protein